MKFQFQNEKISHKEIKLDRITKLMNKRVRLKSLFDFDTVIF